MRELVDRYFRALNAEAWEELGRLFHPQAELQAPLARPRRGREDVLEYYRQALARYPRHHDRPLRVLVDGPVAMVEIDYRATSQEGREVAFTAVDVFEEEDGMIRRLRTYFDSAALLEQLGAR